MTFTAAAQLALDLHPLAEPAHDRDATIQERFEAFHAINPWIFDALVALARDAHARGRRYGIGALFERLRWEYDATTEGEALDAGEDGFAQSFNAAQNGLALQREGLAFRGGEGGELGDICPCGEGAAARAGEQDDADFVVGGELGEGRIELGENHGVERVQDLGAVERDDGQRRAEFEAKSLHARKVSRVGSGVVTAQ